MRVVSCLERVNSAVGECGGKSANPVSEGTDWVASNGRLVARTIHSKQGNGAMARVHQYLSDRGALPNQPSLIPRGRRQASLGNVKPRCRPAFGVGLEGIVKSFLIVVWPLGRALKPNDGKGGSDTILPSSTTTTSRRNDGALKVRSFKLNRLRV
ncbi:hypothetical protein Zmor_013926 [Zophobas morio]|uniref:Uncharacterized protein n=1 Tax=Zophobas morio TaxID=2755281 RepID=A0AA38MFU5_9CUCU|nr:hypothetical protein Zmor_013926 [Zophobas morio]